MGLVSDKVARHGWAERPHVHWHWLLLEEEGSVWETE